MEKETLEALRTLFSPISTNIEKLVALAEVSRPKEKAPSNSSTKEKQRAVLKGPGGEVLDATMRNTGEDILYFGFVDVGRPATDGDTLISPTEVGPGLTGSISYPNGRPFHHGIVAVGSLTDDKVTLPSSGVCIFDVVYLR